MLSVIKEIKNCEVCRNGSLQEVLNLGEHPLCDDLVPINSDRVCELYPITVLLCEKCLTAHQKYQIPKDVLFPSDYHYRARFTKDVLDGMKLLVDDCDDFINGLKRVKVLDIGCNDGSLLNIFADKGSSTVGVEPTGAADDAINSGHKVYKNYFDISLAEQILKDEGQFDVIVFTNVFAHIDDLNSLLIAIKKVLKNDGLLIIENHYLGSVLKKNQFDTFYHEHPRTYSCLSFVYIAEALELEISQVSLTSRYGGNIRVFLSNKENINKNYLNNLIQEEKNSLKNLFIGMNNFINVWKTKTKSRLEEVIRIDGPLIARAFPGRAAILIHLLNFNEEKIEVVYEKYGSLKINHYVPGTRIPIKCESEFFSSKNKHDHILNLAWHIPNEINAYMKENNFLGEIINIIE